ncbi:MAG: site-2 protease family protein [Anaerolineae bacterium]|nr:site-2 protease family protein [Anaerolineae bacterium]
MLFNQLTPERLIANLIALLIAMTIHEFAHNYVGWRMGDPVPAREGRLTLNPFVHINWVGWLMFAIIGFGILGAAPISPYRMPAENRRWRWLAAVAAGPVSNLLLAIIFALIFQLLKPLILSSDLLSLLVLQLVYWNVLLFFFNLLPMFPIDGWHIVYSLLPPDLAIQWERHQQTTQYIFFGLLLVSFLNIPGLPNIFGLLIGQPSSALLRFLLA